MGVFLDDLDPKMLDPVKRRSGGKISIYYPNRGWSRSGLINRIRIFTKSNLQKRGWELGTIQNAISSLRSGIEKLSNVEKGVGIFMRFDGNIELDRVKRLGANPIKEFRSGKIFNIRQLIFNKIRSPKVLSVDLNQKVAKFYSIDKTEKEILSVKNEYYYQLEHDKRYVEKIGINEKQNLWHGGGSDKRQELEEGEVSYFMNKLSNEMSKKIKFENYDYTVIFYSQPVGDHLRKLRDKINLESEKVVEVSRNIEDKNELSRLSRKLITEEQKSKAKKLLHRAKEDNMVVYGWNDVSQALNRGRLQNLFVKNKKHNKPGYVHKTDDNLVHTYPVKNTRRVKDLPSWLTRSALRSNGASVYVFNSISRNNDVIGILRY